MLYKIGMLFEQLSQPVAFPAQSVVQDQLRVGEDVGIEEAWVWPAEEVLVFAEQGG